ncbi:MAG: regulatory protein RecX, partial [Lachnospiraceae bacterium]|nr:regulatory protein RecX [Lachnospiraceae bacterium]
MFLVTGIEELDVKRAKIYLEGELAFVLYKGEVRELQLKVNKELSEPDYVRVLTEILPKRAKKRALYLLQ